MFDRNLKNATAVIYGDKVFKNGRHERRFGVFIVKFEHILHIFVVFLLLNLNK